jgi:hypothetical protein
VRGLAPRRVAERRALVEHALRSAVEAGRGGGAAAPRYGGKAAVGVEKVRFDPPRVAIGGAW